MREVNSLLSWSHRIHTELDGFYNLWSTQEEVTGQEMVELSVNLDLLLDHMINMNLTPMQDVINSLCQSVLILMGRNSQGLTHLPCPRI